MIFWCPIHKHAQKTPKSIAIITPKKKWSYNECETKIRQLASWIHSMDIPPFQTVAILPKLQAETVLLI
ncbi:MAG: hypothetical protein KAR79_00920, partial [Simkaniaceae bacterium]|nr:hypothetical protein [Simkaniaceae bacterium]